MLALIAADSGLTFTYLMKIFGVILAVCVVVGLVVGLSMLFWRFVLWTFFGGRKRGLATVATIAGGLYLNLINPVHIYRNVEAAWAQSPSVALVGIFVLAAPIYIAYSLFSNGSVPSVMQGPMFGQQSGPRSSAPSEWSHSRSDQVRSGWPPPPSTPPPPAPFDSRYGPQQGTRTPADEAGSLYGDGPKQGFVTPADEPGGLYGNGPQL